MIRLFVAVNLADEVNERIGGDPIRRALRSIAWVRPENFHVTVKFVGSVDEGLVAPITEALREPGRKRLPFELGARGIGTFPPTGRKIEVVWVGIEDPSGGLAALATEVDQRLAPLGIAPESRPYTPHLTIGRAPRGGRIVEIPANSRATDFGRTTVREIMLYRSETLPGGARYTRLATIDATGNVLS
jgi:2'-5' RNA ligase